MIAGATGVSYTSGDRSGNGVVTITYNQPVASATALTSATNPSSVGSSVVFTATVTYLNNGTPTAVTSGTVAFTANGTTLSGCGAVALNGSGQATCSTSSLAAGSVPIVATYSGNNTYLTSTANLTQVVNKLAPTAQLVASPNPSDQGGSVTLAVTVNGSGPTPTGTVDVLDGNQPITGCTSLTLVNGSASCTSASLSAGSHGLSMTYSGDATYQSLSGGNLTQVVTATTTTTSTTTTTVADTDLVRTSALPTTGTESASTLVAGLLLVLLGAVLVGLVQAQRLLRRPDTRAWKHRR